MIRLFALFALCLLVLPFAGFAQTIRNLTVYDAGIAQVAEERTIELQPGINQIEWRSLMPKADLRTIRVTVADAVVTRQDVTFDGADVKNEKTPVLHLTIENKVAAGARRVAVDYLAPNISWQNAYSLVLNSDKNAVAPTGGELDSWFSILNNTGVDVNANALDLIAGEIALLRSNNNYNEDSSYAQQNYQINANISAVTEFVSSPETAANQLSAFALFPIGKNLSISANKIVSRFPLFQKLRLPVVQRNSFENNFDQQTFGRNNFVLLPRGLEVRIVGKNPTQAAMPAGAVTIYARSANNLPQVVGQDRIGLTAPNNDFTVSQGRSSTLFGTRRIVERKVVNFKDEDGDTENKRVTTIEITLINRAAAPAEAFIRESIEPYDDNEWQITNSSLPVSNWERLGTNSVQTKTQVSANSKTIITYTVEAK